MQACIKNVAFSICIVAGILTAACATQHDGALVELSNTAYKLQIVNETPIVISQIKYKPCGSAAINFQPIPGNIEPHQKVSLNVYGACIDIVAENAFAEQFAQQPNLQLPKNHTWKIQAAAN